MRSVQYRFDIPLVNRLTRQLIYLLFLLFFLGLFNKAGAEERLNIAVASNFAPALELISRDFTTQTGISVQLIISSSGRLFAQIKNQAPFDLYFSADSERPETLNREGLCMEPELYATGRSVLWSMDEKLCSMKNWKDVLQSPDIKKIAMANPATAPYGTVSRDACMHLTDWSAVEKKIVYGTNVVQAFQYAQSGVSQIAFIALSLALSEKESSGCFWDIPETAPVQQKACVVANRPNTDSAIRFLQYATSGNSVSVRKKFGYM